MLRFFNRGLLPSLLPVRPQLLFQAKQNLSDKSQNQGQEQEVMQSLASSFGFCVTYPALQVVATTKSILESVRKGDWKAYADLCDVDITCFEPGIAKDLPSNIILG